MPRLKLFPNSKTIKISLHCLECERTFTQRTPRLLCDLGTIERRSKGEVLPFSEFYVPARVICPHCQAEDRYDLSGRQYLWMTLVMFWIRWFPPGPDSWFQIAYLGSKDGRVMHPFELRAWYVERVARNPQKMEWRLGYANVLRTQGWKTEAETEYRAVLALVPRQTEALLNLAALLAERGANNEALEHLRLLAAIRPKNARQRDDVTIAQEVLDGTLPLEELEISNPMVRGR